MFYPVGTTLYIIIHSTQEPNAQSIHLNGHTLGFHPQTKKLEGGLTLSHLDSFFQSFPLAFHSYSLKLSIIF